MSISMGVTDGGREIGSITMGVTEMVLGIMVATCEWLSGLTAMTGTCISMSSAGESGCDITDASEAFRSIAPVNQLLYILNSLIRSVV